MKPDSVNDGKKTARGRRKRRAERDSSPEPPTPKKMTDAATPPDVTSVRAKSQRHRKSTADKWNQ
jgi:hypothetical protein